MKGVINRGIQELVEARFGGDAWDAIRREAACDEPAFSPGLDYPDQMTIDLITAAAQYLDMPADEVMIEFGKFWVPNVAVKSYPTLCTLAGNNARDFLLNTDRVHRQVTASITNAHPPSLTPEELPDGRVAIHYASQRKLCPVLHGLILGVGIHFRQELAVTETRCTRNGNSECVFEVTFP